MSTADLDILDDPVPAQAKKKKEEKKPAAELDQTPMEKLGVYVGLIVHFWRAADRSQQPMAAIVTRVGPGSIACNVLQEGGALMRAAGTVLYAGDPRCTNAESGADGVFDFIPPAKVPPPIKRASETMPTRNTTSLKNAF